MRDGFFKSINPKYGKYENLLNICYRLLLFSACVKSALLCLDAPGLSTRDVLLRGHWWIHQQVKTRVCFKEGSCEGNNLVLFVLSSATTVKRRPCTTAAGTLPTAPSSVSRSTGMPNTNVPAAEKDERAVPPLVNHPDDCYSQTQRFLFPRSQNCLEFASHFAPAFKHFS